MLLPRLFPSEVPGIALQIQLLNLNNFLINVIHPRDLNYSQIASDPHISRFDPDPSSDLLIPVSTAHVDVIPRIQSEHAPS